MGEMLALALHSDRAGELQNVGRGGRRALDVEDEGAGPGAERTIGWSWWLGAGGLDKCPARSSTRCMSNLT